MPPYYVALVATETLPVPSRDSLIELSKGSRASLLARDYELADAVIAGTQQGEIDCVELTRCRRKKNEKAEQDRQEREYISTKSRRSYRDGTHGKRKVVPPTILDL